MGNLFCTLWLEISVILTDEKTVHGNYLQVVRVTNISTVRLTPKGHNSTVLVTVIWEVEPIPLRLTGLALDPGTNRDKRLVRPAPSRLHSSIPNQSQAG